MKAPVEMEIEYTYGFCEVFSKDRRGRIFQEFSRSLVESYVKVRINLMDINSIIGSQNLFIFSSVIIILLFSLYSFLLYFLQIVIFLFKRIYIYSMQMYFL